MLIIRQIIIVLSIFGFLYPCSCMEPPPPEDAYEMSNVVFSGQVTDIIEDWNNGFMEISMKSHACFYSLIRREKLKGVFEKLNRDYLAVDWAIIVHLLMLGEFHRISNGLLVLGKDGVSMQPDFIRKMRKKNLESFIPFYEFSRFFIKNVLSSKDNFMIQKLLLIIRIVKFNLKIGLSFIKRFIY